MVYHVVTMIKKWKIKSANRSVKADAFVPDLRYQCMRQRSLIMFIVVAYIALISVCSSHLQLRDSDDASLDNSEAY